MKTIHTSISPKYFCEIYMKDQLQEYKKYLEDRKIPYIFPYENHFMFSHKSYNWYEIKWYYMLRDSMLYRDVKVINRVSGGRFDRENVVRLYNLDMILIEKCLIYSSSLAIQSRFIRRVLFGFNRHFAELDDHSLELYNAMSMLVEEGVYDVL